MISVIIVNHNGEALLEQCLGSLDGIGSECEVLVVDNASTDRSIEMIRSGFADVRVLSQQRNLGFAAANNLAAREAEGDALLLLNADAWLEPGALGRLSAVLESDPKIGLVAPRLSYPDGKRQFVWSPARGVVGEVLQKIRNPYEARAWTHGWPARVVSRLAGRVWFTAACVLVRSEAFHQVGGFDESFFMYFEDVDLCRRLEQNGWRLEQDQSALARHRGGFARSAKVDDIYRPSQLRYYALHRPRWEARYIEARLRRRYGDAAVDGWTEGTAAS